MPRPHIDTAPRWAFGIWIAVTVCYVAAVAWPLQQRASHLVLVAISGAVAGLQGPWLIRFWRWWLAARAPGRPGRMKVFLSFRPVGRTAIVWLEVSDGEQRWYQRVIWQPWLGEPSMRRQREVSLRRGGRRGPYLIEVASFGRIWPAGPAWPGQPWLASLEPGAPDRRLRYRWPTVAIIALLVGGGLGLLWGPAIGALGAAYAVSLWLFLGGPPLAWTVPR